MEPEGKSENTFWDHLEELRKVFFRIAFVVLTFSVIAFLCKKPLFDIILAPQRPDFILYRLFNNMAEWLNLPGLKVEEIHIELINIQLASQFLLHMSTAFWAGILLASPYIIYTVFGFISPALYDRERRNFQKILIPAFFLFWAGILLNYYLIFPLSFRFLATYQVSELVENKISLNSYISTFTTLSFLLGAAFEIPVVVYLLGKLKLIRAAILRKFRKHAIVVILILAAIITPTSDIFTLLLVSIPLYLLYELSIWTIRKV